jgi:hypothetical protein
MADCTLPPEDDDLELGLEGGFDTTASNGSRVRPSFGASQDDFYVPLGNDPWVVAAAKHDFFMHKSDWDDGRGWTVPDDPRYMMGRFLAGAWIMAKSSPTGLRGGNGGPSDTLDWAWFFASNKIYYSAQGLEARCSWATAAARANAEDGWVRVYNEYAYGFTPVLRAMAILHEARHFDYGHDGADGSDPCLSEVIGVCEDGGCSCDEYYLDGSGGRANSYEVWFLKDYLTRAQVATTLQRQSAQDWANTTLRFRFDDRPTFRLNANGSKCRTGETCTYI